MKRNLLLLGSVAALAAPLLGGCVLFPAAMVGGAVTTATIMTDRRTAGTIVSDEVVEKCVSYEISQTILASAEENYRVAFRYYEVGKGDILNLLSAVDQLADARQNKITAFYSVLLNKANLYRSIGKY